MELKDIKRATLFLSFKDYEGGDYAYLFLIENNQLFATDENYNVPEVFDTSSYFDSIDDYCCWSEDISNDFQSFKQMAESIVNDFVEARIEEFEGDPNCLADDNKYTITVFVGEEKVYEDAIFCK
jgi:hypothetical protein